MSTVVGGDQKIAVADLAVALSLGQIKTGSINSVCEKHNQYLTSKKELAGYLLPRKKAQSNFLYFLSLESLKTNKDHLK
jgi:enolase